MPKRVIDFDAMWGSDKIASCAEWAQSEYAWLYGLADASGCFELTNLRVIWGRVAAIRRNLTIERLEQIFVEFHDQGLLFVWEQDGKRYGHWTGSDVPGRLPPPSWRMRLERLAPPVPKRELAEYVSRFARGRAASPGGGFLAGARREEGNLKFEISNLKEGRGEGGGLRNEGLKDGDVKNNGFKDGGRGAAVSAEGNRSGGGECGAAGMDVRNNLKFEISNLKQEPWERGGLRNEGVKDCDVKNNGLKDGGQSGLKGGVEEAQGQGLGLNLDWEGKGERGGVRGGAAAERSGNQEAEIFPSLFFDLNSKATATSNPSSNPTSNAKALVSSNSNANQNPNPDFRDGGMENGKSESVGDGDANACLTAGEIARGNSRAWANSRGNAGTSGAEWRSASAGAFRSKEEILARELRVGEGPSSLGPVRVKPEVLERNRLRDARSSGSRSP